MKFQRFHTLKRSIRQTSQSSDQKHNFRTKTIIISSVIAGLAGIAIWTGYQNHQISQTNSQITTHLQNQYARILYDLNNNLDNVEVSLSKALVANTTKQRGILLGDVWNDAKAAQYKLNALPVNHSAIANTSKFLTQLSDYSYAMLKKNSAKGVISAAEHSNLMKLKDYSGYLRIRLRDYVDEIGANGISLNELAGSDNNNLEIAQTSFLQSMTSVNDQIQQYPTLIYDGPFSENVLNIKPRVLVEPKTSVDAAVQKIESIIGKGQIADVRWLKSSDQLRIPVYSLEVLRNGEQTASIHADFTVNGGKLLSLIDAREIGASQIGFQTALKAGADFLKHLGYNDMKATYTLRYDNVLVVNYVRKQADTMLYPDQIKIKIALDNGAIVGVESRQYLIAGKKRTLRKPTLTLSAARARLSAGFRVLNERKALIPLESMHEVLCYEFYGEKDGERYFVYINVVDGSEERILKVVHTENGELTM